MGSVLRLSGRGLAAAVLALGVIGLAVPAAQSYPATVCSVSVTPNPIRSGHPFTVSGHANKPVDWTVTVKAQRTQVVHGHGSTFTHTFQAPKVHKNTQAVVSAKCSGGAGHTIKVMVAAPGTGNGGGHGSQGNQGNQGATAGPHSGSGLPNTGGPAWWIAALAVLLLGGGAFAMRRHRSQE